MIPTFKRTDGSTVTFGEMQKIAVLPHKVRCRAWVRTEESSTNPSTWRELPVITASVSMAEVCQPWGLSMTVEAPQVLKRTTVKDINNEAVTVPAIVNAGVDVNPWGQWIRVVQEVDTPDSKPPIVVPWGFYRVEEVQTRRNILTITGRDAIAALESVNDIVPASLRVLEGRSVKSRCEEAAAWAWPAGTLPWAPVVEWSQALPTVQDKTKQYPDSDARVFIVSILAAQARVITADLDGTAIYRVGLRPPMTGDPVLDIRAGLNLVEVTAKETRGAIRNRVSVQWDEKVGTTANNAQQTTRKKATPVWIQSDPADDPTDIDPRGRFGRQSEFGTATDAKDTAAATKVGLEIINRSIAEATTLSLSMSPAYGILPGDLVTVHDASGNRNGGQVRSGTVDLTQASRWSLEVVPRNPFSTKWWGSAKPITVSTDYGWVTRGSSQVDESCKTATGWRAISGCTLKDTTKTQVSIKASAGTFSFGTVNGWTANGERKARATISVTTPKGDAMEARVGVDGHFGQWKKLPAGRRTTVKSDEGKSDTKDWDFGVAVSGAFGVTVQVRKATVGSTLTLGELVVELPNV